MCDKELTRNGALEVTVCTSGDDINLVVRDISPDYIKDTLKVDRDVCLLSYVPRQARQTQ